MKQTGQNLIFLISQPRAGSTMTQRILGAHSQIHTQSEPWILLHPLNALKSNNLQTKYDIDLYIKGATDFIDNLPGKMKYYENTISEAYHNLYSSILHQEKKSLFLDKTPRYYYIIEELIEYFPHARFIFLWRNPAAVLVSIVRTWSKADWYRLSEWRDDLLIAPELIIKGIKALGNKALSVKYEDLLTDPVSHTQKMCRFLKIPFHEEMIQYGNFEVPDWQYGDQSTVRLKKQPDLVHKDKWHEHLNDPQLWRVVDDYIGLLGDELLKKMGYSYKELSDVLQANKPKLNIEQHSVPLMELLKTSRDTLIENKRLQIQLKSFHETIKLRDLNLKEKSELILQKDSKIRYVDESLKEKDNVIASSKFTIEQKEAHIQLLDKSLKEKDQTITISRTTIAAKEKILGEKDLEIKRLAVLKKELEKTLQDKESDNKILQEVINSKDILISDKEKLLQEFKGLINNHTGQLIEKSNEIIRLQSSNSALSERIKLLVNERSVLENDVSSKDDQIKMIEEKLLNLKASHNSLSQSISKNESEIKLLKDEINKKQKTISELKYLIKQIERSYTFRIGKLFIWPIKKIINK